MQHPLARNKSGRTNTAPGKTRPMPGAAVRAWRLHRRLSLTDVADSARLGPSGRSWLSRAERGLIQNVREERLRALAQVLQVSARTLSAGIPPPPNDAANDNAPPPAGSREARRRTSAIERLRQDVAGLRGEIQRMTDHVEQLMTAYAALASRNFDTDHPTSDTWEAPLIVAADPPAEWRAVVERFRSHVATEVAMQAADGDTLQAHKRVRVKFGDHVVVAHLQPPAQFTHSMTRLEGSDGARCLFMDGISEYFVPLDVHKERGKWAVAHGHLKPAELDQIILTRQQRKDELNAQLKQPNARIRDLYTWRALDELVVNGRYALDDRFSHYGAPPLRQKQIAQTLTRLVGFLNASREASELRFVEDSDWSCFFMAKENQSLLIEMWISPYERVALPPLPPSMRQIADYWVTHNDTRCILCELEIYDDRVIQLFYNHFMRHLWGEPTYTTRERDELVDFLDQLANAVQNNHQQRITELLWTKNKLRIPRAPYAGD